MITVCIKFGQFNVITVLVSGFIRRRRMSLLGGRHFSFGFPDPSVHVMPVGMLPGPPDTLPPRCVKQWTISGNAKRLSSCILTTKLPSVQSSHQMFKSGPRLSLRSPLCERYVMTVKPVYNGIPYNYGHFALSDWFPPTQLLPDNLHRTQTVVLRSCKLFILYFPFFLMCVCHQPEPNSFLSVAGIFFLRKTL